MERTWRARVAVLWLVFLTALILSVDGDSSHVGRSLKAVIAGKGPVKKPPVPESVAKYPPGNDNPLLKPPPKPPASVSKRPELKPAEGRPNHGRKGKRVWRKGKGRGRKGRRGKKWRKGKGRRSGKGLRRKGRGEKKRKGRKGYRGRRGKNRKGRKKNPGRKGWRGGKKRKDRAERKTKKGWRRERRKNKDGKPRRRTKRY